MGLGGCETVVVGLVDATSVFENEEAIDAVIWVARRFDNSLYGSVKLFRCHIYCLWGSRGREVVVLWKVIRGNTEMRNQILFVFWGALLKMDLYSL
jgi:hypothetical protein